MNFSRTLTVSLLVSGLVGLTSCKEKAVAQTKAVAAAPQSVEVVPIERRDLVESLELIGTVAASESAQIRAEVAGLVRAIHFVEGQQVKQGALLIKIDDTELAAQVLQAEAALELAKSSFTRSEDLMRTNASTKAELERASAEYKTAQAQLAFLRSRLDKTEIRAPFDGTVGARTISPGDYVTSQSALTTVDDLSKLKIDFEVPEHYLRRVKTGTTFTVSTRGAESPDATKGEVYFVSISISRETRSSAVKGLLVNPPADLRPGMFASVSLILETRKNALAIPESAILNSTRGTQIVVVDGPKDAPVAKFVPVKLGLRTSGVVEIFTDESVEGKPVVAAGVGALALVPGMKLAPRPANAEMLGLATAAKPNAP
ncbi:efflux RND transporter periplasmic adaptor subunit [Oleiharenicola lentus]|uniref:efflux RND transporter periplasmic adaptor subunit n=1 Tax=Oleiharenicola lentus TaxID=2508720 RepID=UPI003F6735DA